MCQSPQIVDRAESRIDRAVVADGVPAVIVARPDRKQRHQVQVGESEVLEIGDVIAEFTQVLAEEINVQSSTNDLLRLKPVGLVDSSAIQAAKVVVARCPGAGRSDEHLFDVVVKIVSRTVETKEQGKEGCQCSARRVSNSCRFGCLISLADHTSSSRG